MVYTAGSQALAVLEILVHLDSSKLLEHYRLIPVVFDNSMVRAIERKNLPTDWKRRPAPPSVRAIGDAWVESGRSVVLQVPSVVVPGEKNYLLNVLHPDFPRLLIGKPQPYRFDLRLR